MILYRDFDDRQLLQRRDYKVHGRTEHAKVTVITIYLKGYGECCRFVDGCQQRRSLANTEWVNEDPK